MKAVSHPNCYLFIAYCPLYLHRPMVDWCSFDSPRYYPACRFTTFYVAVFLCFAALPTLFVLYNLQKDVGSPPPLEAPSVKKNKRANCLLIIVHCLLLHLLRKVNFSRFWEIKNPLLERTGFEIDVVPPGIEPGTHGFSVRCSTN